jgi:N-acetyl-S-(2-succino)cysteine monooxygenase
VARLRAAAEAGKLSMRQVAQQFLGKAGLTGSPQTVADYITNTVDERGADGFILGSPLLPHGITTFYESVVPLLQERKVFRTEYEFGTLRENLGLPPLR